MKVRSLLPLLPLLATAALGGCDTATQPTQRLTLTSSFHAGVSDGWTAEFADFPAADSAIYLLDSGVRRLPAPLDTTRYALYVAGMNRSDDLFMYLKRRVDGLVPGAAYDVGYEIQLASDAGSGCVGVGGAPGESVYVKAGATTAEPTPVLKDGFHEMSVDKGVQSTGGPSVPVIGDVANGGSQCIDGPYRLKTLTSAGKPIRATADAQGRLWLLIGTDSGYEGYTRLYYSAIRVTLERE